MRAILSALAILCFTAGTAPAQTYPDYTEIYVNDFADLLPSADETRLRAKLTELRDARGIEFTVVTIENMAHFGHDGPIEPFATGLFNYWGVGDATRNDGVMMLVARYDRVLRIEVGSGYGDSLNDAMQDIINDEILPRFRSDDYVSGIDDGVDAVIYELTGSWPGEYEFNAAQRALGGAKRAIDWLGGWLYALLVPLLVLPVRFYRRWRRNHPRICPNDGARMERLPEDWDDTHLQSGQITEEQLRSVDYDVWTCPQCDHVTVEGYRAWFSGYGACRSCGFRTVEGDTTIIRSATKSSSGLKRIDYRCHHCQDTWWAERVIPKVSSSSSSSSSSSFGGGSSSGGGASGSW